jgi:hypothetical protein
LNRDYKNKNAASFDFGLRTELWKGFHLRLGVLALAARQKPLKNKSHSGIKLFYQILKETK